MPLANVQRGRQRGFSLIVVFVLIIVMVGVSGAVMLSAQGDLQVSGHDREAVSALYAAEAGAAWGQWFLYRFAAAATTGTWTGLLQSTDPQVQAAYCAQGAGVVHPFTALPNAAAVAINPGQFIAPLPGTPVLFDSVRNITYQWCIHNNAVDPNYQLTGNPLGDRTDGDNIITIEAYGWYGNGPLSKGLASAHLSVDVAYTTAVNNLANDYQQAGGVGSTKSNTGQRSPTIPASVSVSVN